MSKTLTLDAFHRSLGGSNWIAEGGYDVPGDYGDVASEIEALSDGCALYDGSAWGRVEALGGDARRFLNGFCTANTQSLAADVSVYGLITEVKGHILADATFLGHEDRIWLRVPPGEGNSVREHLVKYVIADDVELLPLDDLIPIWVLGPTAEMQLGRLIDDLPGPGYHLRSSIAGTEVQCEAGSLLGLSGYCLWISASIAATFIPEFADLVVAKWIGHRALENARIAAGGPRWGVDFGVDTLPQEVGLNGAVDYEKGCYLGQEVIARLHYRGQAQRVLCAVEGKASIGAGAEVKTGDEVVGRITSFSTSLGVEEGRGLALLKRKFADARTSLVADQGAAILVIGSCRVGADGLASVDSEAPAGE